jgi:uncharacterized repeat protein (TIGR02543 family)
VNETFENDYYGGFSTPLPSRTGYAPGSWYSTTDSSKTIAAGIYAYAGITPCTDTLTVTQSLTDLTFIHNDTSFGMSWVPNTYTVRFNGNGSNSGSSMNDQEFVYDTAQNLTQNAFVRRYPVNFEYNGATGGNTETSAYAEWTFAGWATSANGAKVYDDGQSVNNLAPGGTFDLYAVWTPGTVTLPTPTRTGYTFLGWFRDSDLTQPVGSDFCPTGFTSVYAKWQKAEPVLAPADGSGVVVDNDDMFIYGLPDGDVETVSDLIDTGLATVTDGYVEYVYSNTAGVIGTGTKVKLFDAFGTLAATYTVIIFGDNDGDGLIRLNDTIDFALFDAYFESSYDYDDLSVPNVRAMDIDGDGTVTGYDMTLVALYDAYLIDEIYQSGGPVVYGNSAGLEFGSADGGTNEAPQGAENAAASGLISYLSRFFSFLINNVFFPAV